MGGVILGDWTHRRGDVGGGRAVAAEIDKARPRIAWTFAPRHGTHVDQVRIAGERVYVATMAPTDPAAPGWERATVYVLEAPTGRVVASRELPDPVPVAAMILEGPLVHVLATRQGEPVYWYALSADDLSPRHRRALALDRAAHWDVLEAWASADGGVWMELDSTASPRAARIGQHQGPAARRVYAFAKDDAVTLAPRAKEGAEPDLAPRDACCVGHLLYAPTAGAWDDAGSSRPPAVWQLQPDGSEAPSPLASSDVTGPSSHAHVLAGGGTVTAIAVAGDPNDRTQPRAKYALVQASIVDRDTGVVRVQSPVERFAMRGAWDGARLARRPSGEVLFQCTDAEGVPSSDVWRLSASGELVAFPLPRETLLLDAALGDSLLVHAEARGGVVVSALDIDKERLLGRRAQTIWSIDTPDLGGSTTVYAGAGHVFARGAEALAAIRL